MMVLDERNRHEEVRLLLPWVANGRISAAEREMAEEHVRQCAACERELALQGQMCEAFTQPDRVVYAPGPSFRKLMDRIDSATPERTVEPATAARSNQRPSLVKRLSHVSLWRPPGLAWAASFLLLFGMTGMMFSAYQWGTKTYTPRTDRVVVNPTVLNIALDRSLPIGEVEELLHANGARIVEGPDNTGVLGVTPIGVIGGHTEPLNVDKQLRALSTRLRADPRVLWVQPLADQRPQDVQEH
jgi:hypothetical protein